MKMTRRQLAFSLFASRAFGAEAPVQAAPVSMTSLPGRIIVLDARGRICLIDTSKSASMQWLNNATSGLLARDVVAGRADKAFGGEERIFVMTFQSASGWQGFIEQYDGSGRPLSVPRIPLPFKGLSGGIAFDAARNRLLVSDSGGRAIHGQALDGKADRRPVAILKELGWVGALAIDPTSQRLFVCDRAKGRVFYLNLATPAPRALALADDRDLRSPSSLAYDETTATLYAADEAADAVFAIPAPARKALISTRWKYVTGKTTMYLRSRNFGDPVALALDDPSGGERRLWIGDRQSRMIFAIHTNIKQAGQVARELKMLRDERRPIRPQPLTIGVRDCRRPATVASSCPTPSIRDRTRSPGAILAPFGHPVEIRSPACSVM